MKQQKLEQEIAALKETVKTGTFKVQFAMVMLMAGRQEEAEEAMTEGLRLLHSVNPTKTTEDPHNGA